MLTELTTFSDVLPRIRQPARPTNHWISVNHRKQAPVGKPHLHLRKSKRITDRYCDALYAMGPIKISAPCRIMLRIASGRSKSVSGFVARGELVLGRNCLCHMMHYANGQVDNHYGTRTDRRGGGVWVWRALLYITLNCINRVIGISVAELLKDDTVIERTECNKHIQQYVRPFLCFSFDTFFPEGFLVVLRKKKMHFLEEFLCRLKLLNY